MCWEQLFKFIELKLSHVWCFAFAVDSTEMHVIYFPKVRIYKHQMVNIHAEYLTRLFNKQCIIHIA